MHKKLRIQNKFYVLFPFTSQSFFLGVHSAILQYNGVLAISNVLDYFRASLGYVTNHISIMVDRKSVKNPLRKSPEGDKKRRKKVGSEVKNVIDQGKETEPQKSYMKGSY